MNICELYALCDKRAHFVIFKNVAYMWTTQQYVKLGQIYCIFFFVLRLGYMA